ncbi:hypothetical protein TURU_103001 [Turdus rufiventris]|nr:hypothetical protein TURU_103001 [Turdus rufiventris]
MAPPLSGLGRPRDPWLRDGRYDPFLLTPVALSKCLSSETSLGEKALESLEEKDFSNPSSANEKMNTMGEMRLIVQYALSDGQSRDICHPGSARCELSQDLREPWGENQDLQEVTNSCLVAIKTRCPWKRCCPASLLLGDTASGECYLLLSLSPAAREANSAQGDNGWPKKFTKKNRDKSGLTVYEKEGKFKILENIDCMGVVAW